jgi:membrane protein
LFPAIIFLFTLIPYIPIDNFQNQLLALIKNILPSNAYESTRETIEDIVKHQRSGLLSLGFVFALYFTSNGFMAMMKGFNTSYHIAERRKPWKQRWVAIVLTFIISVLVLTATILIVFGKMMLKFLVKNHIIKHATNVIIISAIQWIVVLAPDLFCHLFSLLLWACGKETMEIFICRFHSSFIFYSSHFIWFWILCK